MNREIKFRAWDGEKMTGQIRLEFAHGLRLISTSDLGFGMIGDDKCIIMEYTGMKDKNGKEICEGDIVKNEFTSINKIVFSDGGFKVTSGTSVGNYLGHFVENLEVIGNIYENPELLEVPFN